MFNFLSLIELPRNIFVIEMAHCLPWFFLRSICHDKPNLLYVQENLALWDSVYKCFFLFSVFLKISSLIKLSVHCILSIFLQNNISVAANVLFIWLNIASKHCNKKYGNFIRYYVDTLWWMENKLLFINNAILTRQIDSEFYKRLLVFACYFRPF